MSTLQHEWQDRLPTVAGTNEPIPEGHIGLYYAEGEYDDHPDQIAYYWRGVERAVVYPDYTVTQTPNGTRKVPNGRFGWWVSFEKWSGRGDVRERHLYAEGEAESEEAALRDADEILTAFEKVWNRG